MGILKMHVDFFLSTFDLFVPLGPLCWEKPDTVKVCRSSCGTTSPASGPLTFDLRHDQTLTHLMLRDIERRSIWPTSLRAAITKACRHHEGADRRHGGADHHHEGTGRHHWGMGHCSFRADPMDLCTVEAPGRGTDEPIPHSLNIGIRLDPTFALIFKSLPCMRTTKY